MTASSEPQVTPSSWPSHPLLRPEGAVELPLVDPRYQETHSWLIDEAEMLDQGRYADWYERLAPELDYVAPVRNTSAGSLASGVSTETFLFRDDHYSMGKRIDRLATEHAWAEDPPSRLRHLVTNIRVYADADEDKVLARSYVLVRRGRGDRPVEELAASRRDVFRRTPSGLLLASRAILVDDAVLRTQTLAFFL